MHHCEYQGKDADFRVRWAETMVGDINFELIQSLGGSNPFAGLRRPERRGHQLDRGDVPDARGVGAGQGAVRGATASASPRSSHIGDHIEWYFLDTEPTFKCIIESGSGHALDFHQASAVYP